MLRKAFTILAIGITFAAAGAVKSQAQDFTTRVHINGYNSAAGYLIWDTLGSDGTRGVFIAFNDGKGIGTASLSTMTTADLNSGGAHYAGTMTYTPTGSKKSATYGFSLVFDASTSSVAFSMWNLKTSALSVNNAAASLDPSSLIIFNP